MALYDVMLYSRLLIHFDFIFTHRFSSSFQYEVNSKLLLKRTEGEREGGGKGKGLRIEVTSSGEAGAPPNEHLPLHHTTAYTHRNSCSLICETLIRACARQSRC